MSLFTLGIQLCSIDILGSMLCTFLISNPLHPVSIGYSHFVLSLPVSTYVIIRRVSRITAAYNLVAGTVKMSSTGRATILTASFVLALTGTGFLVNKG
jgi:hypothetical protein